jgi:hypothetical protein
MSGMAKGFGKPGRLFGANQTPTFFDIAQILPRDSDLLRQNRLCDFVANPKCLNRFPEGQRTTE